MLKNFMSSSLWVLVFMVACLGVVPTSADLPEDFVFSVATAAFQIEGAWQTDGKGPSIWDNLTHSRPDLFFKQEVADVACDSYHLYEEDIHWIKTIGFHMYRFSISWPRILPNGDLSVINHAGIDYYHKLIDGLLENGIEPMVTIYHWDLPQKLQDVGGWQNSTIVYKVLTYADLLFREYGDKVQWWITINEPFFIASGYSTKIMAPALNLDSPANYIVGHNLLRAHGQIYRLYDRFYRTKQKGKISMALSSFYYFPASNSTDDRAAAEQAMQMEFGWFANPVFSVDGDYPAIMRHRVDNHSKEEGRSTSRLPYFTQKEIDYIKGSADFFGVNHYSSAICSFSNGPFRTLTEKDLGVFWYQDSSWPSSHAEFFKVIPLGLRELLRWITNHYNSPSIFITENGYCDKNAPLDIDRIKFYHGYLSAVVDAIDTYGCNVIGFTAWTLIDNFEWMKGFDYQFGLVSVNFNSTQRQRSPKLSAAYFRQLISENSIPSVASYENMDPETVRTIIYK